MMLENSETLSAKFKRYGREMYEGVKDAIDPDSPNSKKELMAAGTLIALGAVSGTPGGLCLAVVFTACSVINIKASGEEVIWRKESAARRQKEAEDHRYKNPELF